jgi:Bifunctional DNA primase/polymerase, N-terminal
MTNEREAQADEPSVLVIVAAAQAKKEATMSCDWNDGINSCNDWIDITDYYGPPDPPLVATGKKKDFYPRAELALALFGGLPAFETDMEIIPVDPGGKRPAKGFLPNHEAIPKTEEGIALAALRFPHANAGIRSRRAEGAIIGLDVDRPGVVARYEAETGRKLPRTYTTQTRPLSAPEKMHMFWMSSPLSVGSLPKQVTDVTAECGYDLKGNGGWGYLVTEGSVRDGEEIKVLDPSPIAVIPDDFVEWVAQDVAKGRERKRARRAAERKAEAAERAATALARGFAVPRGDRNWTLWSRIRTWKNTGMTDAEVLPLAVAHIRAHFEDGCEMLTPDGMSKLRARIRKVPTLGDQSYRNLLRDRRPRRKPASRRMRERIEAAPAQLTSAEARTLLKVHDDADQQRMCRQLHRAGFVVTGRRGSHQRLWTRSRPAHDSRPRPVLDSRSCRRSPVSCSSPYREAAAHAVERTSSGCEGRAFRASQVAAAKEVGRVASTFTFEKDGRVISAARPSFPPDWESSTAEIERERQRRRKRAGGAA